MGVSLIQYITEVIEGKRRAPLLKALLYLPSKLYQAFIYLRNRAYDCHLLPTKKLNIPVISIGGIAAGGTGKTPLTALLTSTLKSHHHLAIITRGFKSQIEYQRTSTLLDPTLPNAASLYGDEPLLLAHKTHVPIFVGPNRYESGKLAERQGAKLLILDDGLQHRKLHQDTEIAVIDAQDPFCNGHFLPYGLLRDEIKTLSRVDLIVAHPIHSSSDYEALCTALSPHTQAPIVGMRKAPKLQVPLPQKVGLFCGIGKPAGFIQTVRDLKAEIVDTLISLDHEVPSKDLLLLFAKQCKAQGAEALVCTEKDLVKLTGLEDLPLPVIAVPIELEIVAGQNHWEQLLKDERSS